MRIDEFQQQYYTVSQKNVPHLDTLGLITISFGVNVTEKVRNQDVLYFSTSANQCFCTTWRNRKPGNCIFSLKCCMFFYQKHETLKYHPVKTEPPFIVKTIDWVHKTGPREHSILLSVTHTLYVNQVRSSLSRCWLLCERWELFFIKPGVKISSLY